MEEMNKLHESINFKNLIYHYKGTNRDVNFNDFIDSETHFNKPKLHKMKLEDLVKNQLKFK